MKHGFGGYSLYGRAIQPSFVHVAAQLALGVNHGQSD